MNARKLALAALATLSLAILLVAASPKDGKEPDFKAMQAEVDKAWCSLDAKKAAPYYAHDAKLTFFDVAPLKYNNWTEYQDGAQKAFLDGAKNMKFVSTGDEQVTRKGDVAWMTRTIKLVADMKDGKPLQLDCRDTVIWARHGDTWLIEHEHVSTPLPG
jgi:ketosteroid isomerase-like protein